MHCVCVTKVIHVHNQSIAVLLIRVTKLIVMIFWYALAHVSGLYKKANSLYLQLFLPSPLVEVSRVTSAVRGHGFILRS